ncbi:MAG: radical SAM protein [Rhodospirillaceae bacterium]|jgi:anaerobic magnesium-protoporphyrin IX monomethyl ester cyclase|nr:radical SAM protein [Rhodospirillaceae bacterium]MBT5563548.1 radical SAM protein [Rhodospirillaceae bacterium]MBT7137727.1 radical SAM protein [Rhodospirillaceae bacterium]
MITSRGCPHRCSFCKLNFQKTIARSAENIVNEFRKIRSLGIQEVEIYDDTFTWGKERLRNICEGLIKDNNKITWAVRDRVTAARLDLYGLMYEAGCRRIHFGVELGVQRILNRMQKNITTEQARYAVKTARQSGLQVLTHFMFGNLDETVADMMQTIDFALELDADYAEFSITIPYAGTAMYKEGLSPGIISHDFWLDNAKCPTPGMRPAQVIESHADLDTLQGILNEANRRFYFRPRYILREFSRLRSLGEFMRKSQIGYRLAASIFAG